MVALPGLCGNQPLIILTSKRDDLHSALEATVEGIGESHGERGSQKIDINLQVPRGITPLKRHGAAAAIG